MRTADEVIRIGYAQKARPLYFSGIEDSALVDDGSMIGKAEVIQPLVARDCAGKLPEVNFPIADYTQSEQRNRQPPRGDHLARITP